MLYSRHLALKQQGEVMKICLFDLNGTILNDTPIWNESVRKTFESQGKVAPTIAKYFQELELFNSDYLEIYRSRGVTLGREDLDAIYQKFYEELVVTASLTPHVIETLMFLKNRGVIMGLITGQPEVLVVPILIRFELGQFFKYVKFYTLNKKAAITEIIRQENISPEDCCYVGDAPSDVRHANQAGVISVAFLDKHIPEELIMATKPKMTIRDFRKLTLINIF